jgi:hypothetical protein
MSVPALTKPEFVTCLAYLTAGVGKPMTKEQIGVYYDALSDIPLPVLQACCRRAIQEQQDNWLPAVGRIRALAAEALNGLLPQTGQEWSAVLAAIRKFGYPRPAEGMASLSPLAQHAIKSIGGWQTLCNAENLPVLSAQFRTAYESAATRETQLRQISAELRPTITGGRPIVAITHSDSRTLSVPQTKRADIDGAVQHLAGRFAVTKEDAM